MTSFIVYLILSIVYLAAAYAIKQIVTPAQIGAWYKKVIFHVIALPVTVVGWIGAVLSVKLAGVSIFEKLAAWLKA